MFIMEQGISGTYQEYYGEHVPLHFLYEYKTGFKNIPHHHIGEDQYHEPERNPGNSPSDKFIDRLNEQNKFSNSFHNGSLKVFGKLPR